MSEDAKPDRKTGPKTGLAGNLTRATIRSPLTPLILIAAIVFGLLALATIPREEEPQISVPMVDIHVQADGLKAADAVQLVTEPLEQIVKSIKGVKHVYSQTQDDRVLVTARFKVGTPEDTALLRVHEKIRANYNRIPVGIPPPLIVGRGINDVAIVTLTLSPKPSAAGRWSAGELTLLAEKLKAEVVKVKDVGLTYLAGGDPPQITVEPEPEKMAEYGVTLQQLAARLKGANEEFSAGAVRQDGKAMTVVAGQTLFGIPDIGLLLVTTRDGRPVYVKDIARIVSGPRPEEQRVWTVTKDGKTWNEPVPAVTLAVAKRAGANAVVVADDILKRVHLLEKQHMIPADVHVEVTRNYGHSANEKANELLFHLALATVSIVLLIGLAIGWREAAVTFVIIPVTILLTLFAAKLMGYSINRVSLFALIFSIGILVDDAIVVIENIARHWGMPDRRSKAEAAIGAVAEVGNPTIVATLTVVAALLPMLFVSGMMGPYMAPIPVNATAAMLFSFFIAVTIAPWLMVKIGKNSELAAPNQNIERHDGGKLGALYRRVAAPVIASKQSAWKFLLFVGAATLLSLGLFATRSVTVKLLPFDNKSELSIVADLPAGATLEDTERTLLEAAKVAGEIPEVKSMQIYAGTPAPFNFNGLVRHYYLRRSPELGELQINLYPKADRGRTSHAIALSLRKMLKAAPELKGKLLKVVEVPPGPPVLATLLAEVYSPNAKVRFEVAQKLKKIFAEVPYITDIDDSYGHPRPQLHIAIDQDKLEYFGVRQSDVYSTIRMLMDGVPIGYSHRGAGHAPVAIDMRLPKRDLSWTQQLAATPVPANLEPGDKSVVELGDVVHVTDEKGSRVIFRHNGRYVDMVTAALAGKYEAPVYAMLDVDRIINGTNWGNLPKPAIKYHGAPLNEAHPTLLWDGEWEITYVTFRDMGLAFGVALLGIYVLVVAQFKSFKLPLVILTPVPLTFIGIMFGHWLFNAPFTATSMIGFIALAGIIVRNSILLVDFIRCRCVDGRPLRDVLLEAGAVRFRPILLTALAAMIGAVTIISDPIFQGLAISLLFGLASSTILTVLVIPAIYIVLRDDGKPLTINPKEKNNEH